MRSLGGSWTCLPLLRIIHRTCRIVSVDQGGSFHGEHRQPPGKHPRETFRVRRDGTWLAGIVNRPESFRQLTATTSPQENDDIDNHARMAKRTFAGKTLRFAARQRSRESRKDKHETRANFRNQQSAAGILFVARTATVTECFRRQGHNLLKVVGDAIHCRIWGITSLSLVVANSSSHRTPAVEC